MSPLCMRLTLTIQRKLCDPNQWCNLKIQRQAQKNIPWSLKKMEKVALVLGMWVFDKKKRLINNRLFSFDISAVGWPFFHILSTYARLEPPLVLDLRRPSQSGAAAQGHVPFGLNIKTPMISTRILNSSSTPLLDHLDLI